MNPEYWQTIEADALRKLEYAREQLAKLALRAVEVLTAPVEALGMEEGSGDL